MSSVLLLCAALPTLLKGNSCRLPHCRRVATLRGLRLIRMAAVTSERHRHLKVQPC